ncbi:ComF family protein [Nocardia paucivorans]|uniref:ComF family protein n=1 Tax=Nocardia paucivorans TaxID=114259 RepID=UPI0005927DA0|nr:ComF family protein [Nocardia paucivorans]
MRTLLDLVLPVLCAGCGRSGTGWCGECAASLAGPPLRVWPRIDPGVPCWALGRYRGPARQAVLSAKERGRRDLADPLGAALANGLARLCVPDRPLVLIPAPTRSAAARRRGGDPVLRMTRVAARRLEPHWLSGCQVAPGLRLWWGVRDSAGLSAQRRCQNLRGRITAVPMPHIPTYAQVVLVDDVLTTGTTAAVSIHALSRVGTHVDGVLVSCAT